MSVLRVLYGLSARRRGAQVTMASRVPGEIEPWHVFGDPGEPALDPHYGNISGRAPAAYRKDPDGFVYLRGTLQGFLPLAGSNGFFLAFTLPVGYRPATFGILPTALLQPNYGATARANLNIWADGVVHVHTKSYAAGTVDNPESVMGHIYLDGRRFRIR